MNRTFLVIAVASLVLLGGVILASALTGDLDDAAASGLPVGFELVKSQFTVPAEMSASARRGRIFETEAIPGYSILKFPWNRSDGTSKGTCVSVHSDVLSEAGPYCFTSRQVSACNALISLHRPVGDFVTFGFVRSTVTSVKVRSRRHVKHVPAQGGIFVTLTSKDVEGCDL
jgi:hypothetical protein